MAYIEDRLSSIESKLDQVLGLLGGATTAPSPVAEAPVTKPEKSTRGKKEKPEPDSAAPAPEKPAPTSAPIDIDAEREKVREELMAARDKGIKPKELLTKLGFNALSDAKTIEDLEHIRSHLEVPF